VVQGIQNKMAQWTLHQCLRHYQVGFLHFFQAAANLFAVDIKIAIYVLKTKFYILFCTRL
jgi:hypothetical protein